MSQNKNIRILIMYIRTKSLDKRNYYSINKNYNSSI